VGLLWASDGPSASRDLQRGPEEARGCYQVNSGIAQDPKGVGPGAYLDQNRVPYPRKMDADHKDKPDSKYPFNLTLKLSESAENTHLEHRVRG
jgi:hypothetical protein